MKEIYEIPQFLVWGTTVCDVITASGDPPKKVTAGGAQSNEESGVDWGGMW